MSAQIPLNLPYQNSKTAEDFLVSDANKDAFSWVKTDSPPFSIALILGESGCGKTHLAHIFSPVVIQGSELDEAVLSCLSPRVAVDNVESAPEVVLFHLYNIAKEQQVPFLMTARKTPTWQLPDLKTRMRTIPTLTIQPPDDFLMMSLLCKAFISRQVDVDSDVVAYLLTHLDRSYIAIHQIVELADNVSLSQKRRITIPLIKEAIQSLK